MYYFRVKNVEQKRFVEWFEEIGDIYLDSDSSVTEFEFEGDGSFGYERLEIIAKEMVCKFEGICFDISNDWESPEYILTTTVICDGKTLKVKADLRLFEDSCEEEYEDDMQEEIEDRRSFYEDEMGVPYSAEYLIKDLMADK